MRVLRATAGEAKAALMVPVPAEDGLP
jgi:hypothetical protein